jgi:hypothetical protein
MPFFHDAMPLFLSAMPLLIEKNVAPCIADVPFFISSNDL